MIRKLIQLGNPVLRETAKDMNLSTEAAVQALFADLLDTLQAAQGVGIAAPQIGESVKAAIVAPHPNARYPQAPEAGPIALINPEIIWASKTLEKDWEGCLSVPGVRGLVARHTLLKVRYWDARTGKKVLVKVSGFTARVFQHELDHLQGTVFLDRVENKLDLADEAAYQRLLTEKQGGVG
jgi:peptide deformylase